MEDGDSADQRCPKVSLLIFNSLSMIILTLLKPSGTFSASAGLKFILGMVVEEKKPWRATENPFLNNRTPT